MLWPILFSLLFSVGSIAEDAFELSSDELNPDTEEILIKKPEKYLRHESMLYDFNTDLGIKDQRKYTGGDRHRFTVAGHVSAGYEHFYNLMGLDASYFYRSSRYHQLWYGLHFFHLYSKFGTVTQNQTLSSSDDANDDSRFQRPNEAKNTILAAGPGVSYRFKLILDFLPTDDVFENIDVFINYVQFNESEINKTYVGPGLTTSYGIHKRSDSHYFYGGKVSYNLASVTRGAIGGEAKADRSLTLGWLSFGFELGLFY